VEKAAIVTYSERVSVALVIQHAMRMRHTVICGLSGYTIFFPRFSTNDTFLEKAVIEHKMCVLIVSTPSVSL
jgi:hypothetical protein